MNFKESTKFYITESERSDKVANAMNLGRLSQLARHLNHDKSAVSFINNLIASAKKTTNTSSFIKNAFEKLETEDPKLFDIFAANAEDVVITLGKHTPWTAEELKKKAKKRRYEDVEKLGLKGQDRDKELHRARAEDERLSKKDAAAAANWKAGEKLENDEDAGKPQLAYGKFKTKGKEEELRNKFKADAAKYARLKRKGK